MCMHAMNSLDVLLFSEVCEVLALWLEGTGDLAHDMENQMNANSLRIEVLERENGKLKKSLCKLVGMNKASTVASRQGSAPVQLWNYNANNS